MHEDIAKSKLGHLIHRLKELSPLLVAFSGGVDSTYLLAVAHQTLGDNLMAATADSAIRHARDTQDAKNFVSARGIRHVLFRSKEMEIQDFVDNRADRCYQCKRHLFQILFKIAGEYGIKQVIHGANIDDLKGYRPGFRAANEAGVHAPLVDAQLGKEEIRFLSRQMGLSTWNKPPASCLATRIPYDSPITEKKLEMIEEAETLLIKEGFTEFRVRHHGSVARIEIGGGDMNTVFPEGLRKVIVAKFRKIGFDHVALDLEGYVPGSLNRGLAKIKGKWAGK